MKRLSGTFMLLVFITGCGEPSGTSEKRIIEKRVPIELEQSDVFNVGRIFAYLKNENKFIEEANAFFLKGLNAFKNESNLDSADYYLRQSILKEPSAKAYYELGNVYLDKTDYEDAILAYSLAEQLDFQPVSKILYNKSCIYSLQEEVELSGKYLEYALQAGYTNLDHLNKDDDLAELRETRFFNDAIKKGTRGMSNAENLYWLQFKRMFSKLPTPHKARMNIDNESASNLEYISYEYEKYIAEMRDDKFSREVSKGFYYYAQMYETDAFVGLVYIVKDEFMGVDAPLTYRLATFTHDGILIDKKDVGGRVLLTDPIMAPTFLKDQSINVELIQLTYEHDPEEYGYYENPVISKEKIGSTEFIIDEQGRINQSEIVLEAKEIASEV